MEPGSSPFEQLTMQMSKNKQDINGTNLITDEYYKRSDAKVVMAEVTNHCRTKIDLNSLRFNGASSFRIISSDNILKHVLLTVSLSSPPPILPPRLNTSRLALPKYWLYHAIRSIRFTFPSSNQTMTLTGTALFYELYLKSPSMERFYDMISNSGRYSEQALPGSSDTYNLLPDKWSQRPAVGTVVLDLSVLNTLACSKGIPVDIGSATIDVTIEFKAPKDFIENYTEEYYPFNEFKSADVLLHTVKFTDNNNSIKYDLLKNNNEMTKYSIPYFQIRDSSSFTQNMVYLGLPQRVYTPRISYNIAGIEFSDLMTIVVRVYPTNFPSNRINPFFCSRVEDVILKNAGQEIVNMLGNTHETLNSIQNGRVGTSKLMLPVNNTAISGMDNTTNLDRPPTYIMEGQPLVISLASDNCYLCNNYIHNTKKYSTSELTISFNIVCDTTTVGTSEYNIETYLVHPAVLSYSGMSSTVNLL